MAPGQDRCTTTQREHACAIVRTLASEVAPRTAGEGVPYELWRRPWREEDVRPVVHRRHDPIFVCAGHSVPAINGAVDAARCHREDAAVAEQRTARVAANSDPVWIIAFGQEEGLQVRAEADPEVVKALDLLPQAKTLADNARRVVAERNSAHALNR